MTSICPDQLSGKREHRSTLPAEKVGDDSLSG
jgi:hypothetical protein